MIAIIVLNLDSITASWASHLRLSTSDKEERAPGAVGLGHIPSPRVTSGGVTTDKSLLCKDDVFIHKLGMVAVLQAVED